MNTRTSRLFHSGLWLVLSAVLLFTITGFAGAIWYYADLFAHFRVQLLLGAMCVAFVFGLRRSWKGATTAVALALVNLSAMSSHLAPEPALSASNSSSHPLRCISFNVLQGNHETDRLEGFLRKSQADVILLQEVSPKHTLMLQSMADQYPHQLVLGKKNSKGAALLTRLPSRDLRFHPFEEGEIGAVAGGVKVGTAWVTIMGLHSHKPTSDQGAATQRRYFQWASEKSNAAASLGPVILMGDFNSTPWSAAFRTFAARSVLLDTSRGSIFSATWSVASPQRLLIDHAFVSRGTRVKERKVAKDVGSDHRPLILDLLIEQTSQVGGDAN